MASATYIPDQSLTIYSSIDPPVETNKIVDSGTNVSVQVDANGDPVIESVNINNVSYSYYKTQDGQYIPRGDLSGMSLNQYGTCTVNVSDTSSQGATNAADDADNQAAEDSTQSALDTVQDIVDYSDQAWADQQAGNSFLDISNILGVFGIPYQFMEHVDPRLNASGNDRVNSIGAEYADKIVSTMPLLFLSPGKPSFMSGYSTEEQKTTLANIISNSVGGAVNLDDLISENGKFYTFEYDVVDYYKYVNPMCRITARLLGLQDSDYAINGSNPDNVNWMSYTQKIVSGIADMATDYLAIPFYIDTETQISESISNDVTDTSLASTVDGFSDMGRELMFYLGYTPALAGFDNISDSVMNNVETLKEYVNSISGDNIFKTLAQQITAVATGGRLIFPKIWSDSSFSRSYDVTIKLRSPDMDNYSVWLNIIVPLCHILGFTMPHMVEQNPNAYVSPFLVRAMYKGFFNVDMGMITSCNITKGDNAQWNINGIPTSVDVTLTITDLYDSMSITSSGAGLENFKFDTLDNTCQMDYLMNLCGINIYKPEIGRLIDLWYVTNFENRILDITSNLWGSLKQSISSAITNIYRGL